MFQQLICHCTSQFSRLDSWVTIYRNFSAGIWKVFDHVLSSLEGTMEVTYITLEFWGLELVSCHHHKLQLVIWFSIRGFGLKMVWFGFRSGVCFVHKMQNPQFVDHDCCGAIYIMISSCFGLVREVWVVVERWWNVLVGLAICLSSIRFLFQNDKARIPSRPCHLWNLCKCWKSHAEICVILKQTVVIIFFLTFL